MGACTVAASDVSDQMCACKRTWGEIRVDTFAVLILIEWSCKN